VAPVLACLGLLAVDHAIGRGDSLGEFVHPVLQNGGEAMQSVRNGLREACDIDGLGASWLGITSRSSSCSPMTLSLCGSSFSAPDLFNILGQDSALHERGTFLIRIITRQLVEDLAAAVLDLHPLHELPPNIRDPRPLLPRMPEVSGDHFHRICRCGARWLERSAGTHMSTSASTTRPSWRSASTAARGSRTRRP